MTGEITLPVACHAPVGYLGQNVGSFFKEVSQVYRHMVYECVCAIIFILKVIVPCAILI